MRIRHQLIEEGVHGSVEVAEDKMAGVGRKVSRERLEKALTGLHLDGGLDDVDEQTSVAQHSFDNEVVMEKIGRSVSSRYVGYRSEGMRTGKNKSDPVTSSKVTVCTM